MRQILVFYLNLDIPAADFPGGQLNAATEQSCFSTAKEHIERRKSGGQESLCSMRSFAVNLNNPASSLPECGRSSSFYLNLDIPAADFPAAASAPAAKCCD